MLLRHKLTRTVIGLLAVAFVCGALVVFGAVRSYLIARTDDQLTSSARALEQVIASRTASGRTPGLPAGNEEDALLWRALVDQGGAPSLVRLYDSSGKEIQTIVSGETPPTHDVRPVDRTADNPDGAHVERVDGGDGQDWRIRASWLPGSGGVVVVGKRLSDYDAMLRQLALIEAVVTASMLGAVVLLAPRMIRRDLRPLEEIADTARAIGDGDLARRVDHAEPGTEVGRVGLALNTMLTQIETAFRDREISEKRLRDFIADVSHELRTPIASIMGYAELFRRGAASRPDDLARAMGRIESEAARMGELVDELLLLARLDQGRPLEREPVDLAGLVGEVVADASVVDPDRPVRFDGGGPVVVTGDRARLLQVLTNLMVNVRQHTPAGTPVTVRLDVEDGYARVEVADEGPGLTPEQCERVFERFYRVAPQRAQAGGGAGLGLSIVAAVATAHGGDAGVRSNPGEGAVFQVRIPTGA